MNSGQILAQISNYYGRQIGCYIDKAKIFPIFVT